MDVVLKAGEGFTGSGASWGGQWYPLDANRCVTVPEAAVEALTRPIHGFVRASEGPFTPEEPSIPQPQAFRRGAKRA